MRRKRHTPPPPLPQRDGVDPVRVRMPAGEAWRTVRDHLVDRLAPGAEVIDAMFGAGAFVDAQGRPVPPDAPYVPGGSVWFHRERQPEQAVPFAVRVVYRDEHIVVADKPHFLATTPRGSHVTETALARLRRELGIGTLTAAHRLDRLTAGLVLFTVRPEERGAYQTLFRDKRVHKEYEAVAPYIPGLALPRTLCSRIEKTRGVLAAREVPGEPNAVSRVELLEHHPCPTPWPRPDRTAHRPPSGRDPHTRPYPALGRYRLLPHTGRTHQLRVHMNALGAPVLGDPIYPVLTGPVPDGDFRRPLQLLARVLEFTDPVTGLAHRFRSERELQAWSSYAVWDGAER